MRPLCAVPFVLLAGCAAQPVSPVAFRAGAMEPQPSAAAGAPAGDIVTDVGPASASSAAPQDALEDLEVRHFTVLLGMREMEDDDFSDLDLDDHVAIGIIVDEYDGSTGHGFEIGGEASQDDGSVAGFDTDAQMLEVYGGYRHTFDLRDSGNFHPYLAVGASLLQADVDAGVADDDDTALGAYIRAGVNFELDRGMRLGIDWRHLFAEFDLFGTDFEGDFNQLAVTLGFPF